MNDDALDREVREALEPDAGAVERAMRGALSQGRPPRWAYARRLAMAGAIAVAVVGAMILNRDTGAPEVTRITNINDTIVVRTPAGGVWLIGGQGRGDDRLPAGTIVVHRSGESR